MNLMVLKRFKNEFIVLLATIFAIYALYYKSSMISFIQSKKADIQTSIQEISRVIELKKVWKSKKIVKKITNLKNIVSKERVALYKKRGQKIIIKYKELNINELNSVIKYIMNNYFQIVKLKINQSSKERYQMELVCKW